MRKGDTAKVLHEWLMKYGVSKKWNNNNLSKHW
jgi:hypothetical protein